MPVSPRCASQSEIHLLANSVPKSSSGMKFAANIDTYPLFGGADGLDFYRVIADKWRDALLPNGLMAFEVGIGQADQVLRIMRSHGFGDIQIVKDLNNIPRVVYGTRVETI